MLTGRESLIGVWITCLSPAPREMVLCNKGRERQAPQCQRPQRPKERKPVGDQLLATPPLTRTAESPKDNCSPTGRSPEKLSDVVKDMSRPTRCKTKVDGCCSVPWLGKGLRGLSPWRIKGHQEDSPAPSGPCNFQLSALPAFPQPHTSSLSLAQRGQGAAPGHPRPLEPPRPPLKGGRRQPRGEKSRAYRCFVIQVRLR